MSKIFKKYTITINFVEDGQEVEEYQNFYAYEKDYKDLLRNWNELKNGGLEERAKIYSSYSFKKIQFSAYFKAWTYNDEKDYYDKIVIKDYLKTNIYCQGKILDENKKKEIIKKIKSYQDKISKTNKDSYLYLYYQEQLQDYQKQLNEFESME